jgi:hypothetical protein
MVLAIFLHLLACAAQLDSERYRVAMILRLTTGDENRRFFEP